MHMRLAILVFGFFGYQSNLLAASADAGMSPTGGILKMVLGLAAVLAVMALVSWFVKRMLPGGAAQNSAVRIVGGVSVGSRERVVVLEIAGRWVVVGVASGQVSAIANLEAGSENAVEQLAIKANQTSEHVSTDTMRSAALVNPSAVNPLVKPFSEWMKKSADNIKNKFSQK